MPFIIFLSRNDWPSLSRKTRKGASKQSQKNTAEGGCATNSKSAAKPSIPNFTYASLNRHFRRFLTFTPALLFAFLLLELFFFSRPLEFPTLLEFPLWALFSPDWGANMTSRLGLLPSWLRGVRWTSNRTVER